MNTLKTLVVLSTLSTACSESPSRLSADTRGRMLFGPGVEYVATRDYEAELDEMRSSQQFRRRNAWNLVSDALQKSGAHSLPSWISWYDQREVLIIFRGLFRELSQDDQLARAPFSDRSITQALEEHTFRLLTFPNWTQARFEEWSAQLDSQSERAGAGGLPRTLYSPAAVRHILKSYASLLSCHESSSDCDIPKFPTGTAIAKASWTRVLEQRRFPIYLHDPPNLINRLGSQDWSTPEGELESSDADGFTLRLGDAEFLLTGLHIITKDLPDWFWVSLWWSDQPDMDFGSDREAPSALTENYKMCTAVDFFDSSGANDVGEELSQELDTLYHGLPNRSWCSNPYLEEGHGNANTNCIGCHQFAGTGLESEDVLNRSDLGVERVLEEFPADYVYGLSGGSDNLARSFLREVQRAMVR